MEFYEVTFFHNTRDSEGNAISGEVTINSDASDPWPATLKIRYDNYTKVTIHFNKIKEIEEFVASLGESLESAKLVLASVTGQKPND